MADYVDVHYIKLLPHAAT